MGALTAVNAVMECFITAVFTGLILMGMAKIGWLPILFVQELEQKEEDEG